jgi:heat shock protein HtpX
MMWELVRANKRRSTILVIVMLCLLLAVGYVIGAVVAPWILAAAEGAAEDGYPNRHPQAVVDFRNPLGGLIGMGIAFAIWSLQALVSYYFGGKIMLAVSGARRVAKEDAPQLYNVVEEMSIAAQLPKVPDIYIMDDPGMNAFATGRDPMHSAVAVTSGLLGRMNRDQLQGVIAHEVSHIVHRDVLYMTMVGIMVGTIILLCEAFFQVMRVITDGSRYSSRSSSKGNGGIIIVLVLLLISFLLYIIAPILAQMIYFAISRKREYLADAGAAIYTRYPEGLASALEELGRQHQPITRASRATAPMYITNPFAGKVSLMMSSHPPIDDRVKILRSLHGLSRESGQVSYAEYEQAYEQTRGASRRVVPQGAMGLAAAPLRGASSAPEESAIAEERLRRREAGDLVRTLNHFTFLPCSCGARVKVPAGYPKGSVQCPRCGTALSLDNSAAASPGGVPIATPKRRTGSANTPAANPSEPLVYTRKGGGWESIKCSCGAIKNIAPSYTQPETSCARCGRRITLR